MNLALAVPVNPAPLPPSNTFGFYLVWNPDKRMPKRRHSTLKSAQDEAARLSKANPNQSFYVMKSVTVDRTFIQPITVRENTHFDHEAPDGDPHFN